MAEIEGITSNLLDQKYLFHGFSSGKLEWECGTLVRVYQRLLDVYCDTLNYEGEDSPAPQLVHIYRCLRRLGIGHLASKSQDLVDKARSHRIISALDDKISAKYKAHMAARRIRVVIKKEQQKIKTQQQKPRSQQQQEAAAAAAVVEEESSPEDVFPFVPLPKLSHEIPAPQTTKATPIPKTVKTKGSEPKPRPPDPAQCCPRTPEVQHDIIPSGRQLQRTPVSVSKTSTITEPSNSLPSKPSLPFTVRLEGDLHSKAQPTSTQIGNGAPCNDPPLPHPACHEAAVVSSAVEPEGGGVQPVTEKEFIQCRVPLEACTPPLPSCPESLPATPPQNDNRVSVEARIVTLKKPNVIPTGHQIPRTPGLSEEVYEFGLEADWCSDDEMTETLDVQGTALPPIVPQSYREQAHATQERVENKNTGKNAYPVPSESSEMLNIKSPPECSSNESVPVSEGLPEHIVLSPPSGYRDEDVPSKSHSEALEAECMAVMSDSTAPVSPLVNDTSGNTCSQTKSPQEATVSDCRIPVTATLDSDTCSSAISSGSSVFTFESTESPASVATSDDNVTSPGNYESLYKVSDESPSCGTTPTLTSNERTCICNNEKTFVINDKRACVSAKEVTFVVSSDRTFVINNERRICTDSKNTSVSNDTGICDEPGNLEKLMKNICIEATDSPDALFVKPRVMDKVKHQASDDQDISSLCENIDLNCSLKDSVECGECGSEESLSPQGTPLPQNATYIMPAEKLHSNGSHKETKTVSRKDLDGTYVSVKNLDGTCITSEVHLTESNSSNTNVANIPELSSEPHVNVSVINKGTFIGQFQKEGLSLSKDNDDIFEIFPQKHKASRARKGEAPPNVGASTSEKVTEKTDEDENLCCKESEGRHNEAIITTDDDLESIEVKEPILSKMSNKKKLAKETNFEFKNDSPQKVALDAENGARAVCLELNEKLFLKDSHNEVRESSVGCVQKDVRKRRCKLIKTYSENLSSSQSFESDNSWSPTEKKETKFRGNAKKKGKQNSRSGRDKKTKSSALYKGSTGEDEVTELPYVLREQTESNIDEAFRAEVTSHFMDYVASPSSVKCYDENKDSNDIIEESIEITKLDCGSKLEDPVQGAGDSCIIFLKPKTRVKAGQKMSKRDCKLGSETSDKENDDWEPTPLRDRNVKDIRPDRHPKKSNDDLEMAVKKHDHSERSQNKKTDAKETIVDETGTKSKGRRKKTEDEVPGQETDVKSTGRNKKTNANETTAEVTGAKSKGRRKKTEDEDPAKKTKVKPTHNEEPGEETDVKSTGRNKKTDAKETTAEVTGAKSKGRRKKTEDEDPAMKTKVKPTHNKKKDEDEEPGEETAVKSKGRRKKTSVKDTLCDGTIVKPKGRRKKAADEELYEQKMEVDKPVLEETEKKGRKTKGAGQEKNDDQQPSAAPRGRRACAVRARAAVLEILNDSWS